MIFSTEVPSAFVVDTDWLAYLEEPSPVSSEEGREDEGFDGHKLDEDVKGRPRCVLEWIANCVADYRGLMGIRPLRSQ